MAKFEFFLDLEITEQTKIATELSKYNTRVHAEVVRHAFVVSNVFCDDLSYKAVLEKAGIGLYFQEEPAELNSDRYLKLMLNWGGVVKPLSLKRVIDELRIIAKPARHKYLLGLFLIGNRLIKGEIQTHSFSTGKAKETSYEEQKEPNENKAKSPNNHVSVSETTKASISSAKNTKSALSGLMKRSQ
ncbi:MAG: hypothetical protein CML20_18360 [Rheinheimera sp.]|jgi:hypothetical protein|nr:hypothetical protein [Rheinheimera sp.]|tara:strand:+ start:7014 stop:7574 length:561 start_codon:yes stop_codon:yes gene_type:complete